MTSGRLLNLPGLAQTVRLRREIMEVLEAAWLEATKEAHASFEAWEMMPQQHTRR